MSYVTLGIYFIITSCACCTTTLPLIFSHREVKPKRCWKSWGAYFSQISRRDFEKYGIFPRNNVWPDLNQINYNFLDHVIHLIFFSYKFLLRKLLKEVCQDGTEWSEQKITTIFKWSPDNIAHCIVLFLTLYYPWHQLP